MVRTKNPEVEADYSERYGFPFRLVSEWEGNVFTKFVENEVTRPRYIDWDLIRELRIEAKVVRYLKNLGIETFARETDYSAYSELTHEFLCTMSVSPDKKKLSVRMKNKKYTISLQRMKRVFGFSTTGERERPKGYNPNVDWAALTGFNNWDSSEMSNGYLTDPALAIVHKFISYNISGKEQGNKVNATEVYLLSCAKNGTKVCISNFIWQAMAQSKIRASAHPSFGAIITGLAHNIGVLTATKGLQDGNEELEPYLIDYSELFRAGLISDRQTVVPPAKRLCVRKFVNKEIAEGRQPPNFEAESSNAVAGDEEEDEAEEEEPLSLVPMSGDGYQHILNHFDSSFATFREDVSSQFATLRQDVNSIFEEHNQQFTTFSQNVNSQFEAQNQQIAALQSQFNAWSTFYPPPQPPPNFDEQ